jgi:hypothetical protein
LSCRLFRPCSAWCSSCLCGEPLESGVGCLMDCHRSRSYLELLEVSMVATRTNRFGRRKPAWLVAFWGIAYISGHAGGRPREPRRGAVRFTVAASICRSDDVSE